MSLNVVEIGDEGREIRDRALAAREEAEARRMEEEALDKMLAPFADNLPYDVNRLISEVKVCLQVEIVARFEIGKRLLMLQEREGVSTLRQILEEHFSGLSRPTAYRYMMFARKAAEIPKFRAFANGRDNWSKALTLMSSVDEEELKALEDGGSVMGMTVDDLDKMSLRDLKCRIKKLEKQRGEAVKEATEKLVEENQDLKSKIEALEAAANPDFVAAEKLVRQAEKKFLDACELLRQIPLAALKADKVLHQQCIAIAMKFSRMADGLDAEFAAAGGEAYE